MKPVPNTCPKIQHSCHSLFLASQHNAKRWRSILALVGILAASIDSAPAASIIVNAVGTVNENGKTILEATGNSMDSTTFASIIATAYANDTGGVWDFDGANFGVNAGETITLNYGASQANSVILGLSGTNGINQGNVVGEATSGSFELGLGGDASTRVFTLSTLMSSIGIFSLDRNDASRTSVLSVTFLDDTTASTSGADGDNTYFQILSATGTNYIKSFSLTQNNFIRYDDLGFVVASSAPEPSRALLLMLGTAGLLVRRRRQSSPVLSSVISV
ncbi:MAG: PEP-CTERM sorting domain-containing protein [Prosthecobacter sp.]|uniref:PEP-CTERM sorting domain-containing protein n=1 Tax=Prosthecobacter sp. TaxID=1965333 RepID=UPI00260F211E|nr:PEP-CTERM sorting domain-containing protein [Prosthecobacter sp.]MCF7789387.1 PEP-CTERM sorting domain-containing protein [Prosthecobacter sp.]